MKRIVGFLFVLALIGLFALTAPNVAHAGSCRSSYNFQGVRWVGTGYVHVVYNNDARWAMNNLTRPLEDPYHVDMVLDDCGNVVAQNPIGQGIPATGSIPEPDPMIAQLADRIAVLEQAVNTQATQIASLQNQINPVAPEQGTMAEVGTGGESPRLVTFLSENLTAVIVVGGLFGLLAVAAAIAALVWYRRRRERGTGLSNVTVEDDPLSVTTDEPPTAPWAGGTGPVPPPVFIVDADPVD